MQWLELLSNPNFMPHGHCYLWRPDILWTHVISDAAIALSYYAIPVVLGILLFKRKDSIPYANILGLFIAFILLCGTTHLVNIYVTWYPAYEYQGWLKMLTAAVSVVTAIVLAPKLPELIVIPGIKQAYEKSQAALAEAEEKHCRSQALHQQSLDRESRILELKREVNGLLRAQGNTQKYLANVDDTHG
ncbi:hypothetical protein [Teredinibacter purpureus]|uniref:hypothetical protein n=1 Tax=Teredinibacter purpureus TaxID=2731756 RepID=UPI0005F7D03F|nr:hypothetical protein [Teredinibacter purpureus]